MKEGDVVMVYEDPITQKKPEGKARLVRKVDEQDFSMSFSLQRWIVMFKGDIETYNRTILAQKGEEGDDSV